MKLFRRHEFTPLDQILNPGPAALRKLSPEDLAEYKAGWKPGTKDWILADAEQRRREGWSGPVKVSLAMSGVAMALSVYAAFWRT